jgi:hypothetical protein
MVQSQVRLLAAQGDGTAIGTSSDAANSALNNNQISKIGTRNMEMRMNSKRLAHIAVTETKAC